MRSDLKDKMKSWKDKLYYFAAIKNPGIRREYGPYVDAHRAEHTQNPWEHRKMLLRLNWHYRIMRRTEPLYWGKDAAIRNSGKLPYLNGSESEAFARPAAIHFAKDLLQYDVISFDIFDTLILRPFAKPEDLFMPVGQRLKQTEFMRIRSDAEAEACSRAKLRTGNTEVTVDDIYAVVEERTGIKKEAGIAAEFETELSYCFANPYMKRVYKLLWEQGKTVILTSDMYYPHAMMERLLEKVGYTGYEKLYVSCDYGCTKRSGGLYDRVKQDYAGKTIVHIGDNRVSDIDSAKKSGIEARFYRNCHEIGAPYRADGMSALVGSAYAGIVNTHLHNGIQTYSAYYEYGFLYGGLYIVGFCDWMHRKAKQEGIDKILFLSRDGAIYQKVFNMMFRDVPNEYFLWSRIANTKYTALKNREDFLRRCVFFRIVRTEERISIASLLDTLSLQALMEFLPDYGFSPDTVLLAENQRQVEELFIEHWDTVVASYSEQKEHLKEYLFRKLGNAKKVAVVDVGWFGSGPMGLKYLIEDEFDIGVQVRCWVAASRPHRQSDLATFLLDGTLEAYMFSGMLNKNLYDVHAYTNDGCNNLFFELFTQATHPSYGGFDDAGDFLFDFPECESYDIFREIHRGISDFAEIYIKTFERDPYLYHITGYDAYCPFRLAIRSIEYMKQLFENLPYARSLGGNSKEMKMATIGEILKGAGH